MGQNICEDEELHVTDAQNDEEGNVDNTPEEPTDIQKHTEIILAAVDAATKEQAQKYKDKIYHGCMFKHSDKVQLQVRLQIIIFYNKY